MKKILSTRSPLAPYLGRSIQALPTNYCGVVLPSPAHPCLRTIRHSHKSLEVVWTIPEHTTKHPRDRPRTMTWILKWLPCSPTG